MRKLFLFCLCAIVGCSTKESTPLIHVGSDQMFSMEAEKVDIAEFCGSVGTVALETSDESIIGVVDDIVAYDDKIVLLWEGKCSVFNKDGSFVANVGMKGNGPNEYGWFEYVFISSEGNIVLYDSSKNKLFHYDILGNFILANEIPVRLSNSRGAFMSDKSSIGFYMPDKGYCSDWKMIQFVGLDGSVGDSIVVSSKLTKPSNVNWYFKECSFVEYENGTRVKYTFNDTVYNVVANKEGYSLDPAMVFDLGKYSAIENAREKSFQAMMTSARYNPFDYMAKIELLGESAKYLFFAANGSKEFFYDKSMDVIHRYAFVNDKSEEIIPLKIDKSGYIWMIKELDNDCNPQVLYCKIR